MKTKEDVLNTPIAKLEIKYFLGIFPYYKTTYIPLKESEQYIMFEKMIDYVFKED